MCRRVGSLWRDNLIFDVVILAICVVLYCVNQFVLKSMIGGELLMCHFNDFVAIVALLSFANIMAVLLHLSRLLIRELRYTLLVAIICSLYWEVITPLYRASIPDWLDVLSYLSGAVFYWAINCIKCNMIELKIWKEM